MASSRQQARDAASRSRGFKNYLDERNFNARLEGYKSYAQQRKARQTGIGLRGKDRPLAPPPAQRPTTPGIAFEPPRTRVRSSPAQTLADRHVSGYRITAATTRTDAMQLVGADVSKGKSFRKPKKIISDFQSKANQDLKSTQQFYSGPLGQFYLDQYRLGIGDPDAKLSHDALKDYQKIFIQGNRDAERAAIGAERSLKARLNELPDLSPRSQRKVVKRDALKAVSFSNGARWDYDKFMEMSLRANAQRSSNVGFIHGAAANGAKLFVIHDGPDCGLTAHLGGPKANGLVVDLDTALEWPIAHPNCQRTFEVADGVDEDPSTVKDIVKSLIKSYAGSVIKESLEETLKSSVKQFVDSHDVQDRVESWVASRASEWPFRFKAESAVTGIREADLVRDLATYADDFAAGRAVPEHVFKVLRVAKTAPARAVGDAFDRWSQWYDQVVSANLSGFSEDSDGEIHNHDIRNIFFGQAHRLMGGVPYGKGPLRFSLPNVGGRVEGMVRRPRLTLVGKDAFRASVTRTDKGLINHLRLNPNGLIRAGFTQIEGQVVPTFSLIPKGPIRLVTRVNRGTAGNITSLSTEVRLITPQKYLDPINHFITKILGDEDFTYKVGTNLSANLNLNLRQLGLRSLRDVRKLTLEDWRDLRETLYYNPITEKFESHDALRLVSTAVQMRLNGANIFDLARTWRVPWEDTRAYWTMTNLELKMADRVRDLEKILERRHGNRIYDINEVVHPFTRAQSKARGRAISLLDQGMVRTGERPGLARPLKLQPLEDAPGGAKPPTIKKERSGFMAPGVRVDATHIPTGRGVGEVTIVATSWEERMVIPTTKKITRQGSVSHIHSMREVETIDEMWDWFEINRDVRRLDRDPEQQVAYLRRFFKRGLWDRIPRSLQDELRETYGITVHAQGEFFDTQ